MTDAAGGQILLGYDTTGRVAYRQNQRGHYARFSYNERGQIAREWGGASQPVEYSYNSYGQLVKG